MDGLNKSDGEKHLVLSKIMLATILTAYEAGRERAPIEEMFPEVERLILKSSLNIVGIEDEITEDAYARLSEQDRFTLSVGAYYAGIVEGLANNAEALEKIRREFKE